MDCPLPRRRHADPHVRLVHLPGGSEHAARGASARPRCDFDDAVPPVRGGSRGPRSACRPACTRMRCCRSAIRWDGLGRSAVSLSPMSSLRTDGVRLTRSDRSQGGDYACSGLQMALALTAAERRRGTLGRNSARGVDPILGLRRPFLGPVPLRVFADARANGEVAPIPAVRVLTRLGPGGP